MSASTVESIGGSYLMPRFEDATVADAMHPGILTCAPEATLTEVARMMATHHVHSVAVMGVAHEPAGEQLVWGIISDLELVHAAFTTGPQQSAGALAREPVISVEPMTPLRDACERMIASEARHVVVVDPKLERPIGVLSTLDVAGVIAWGEA